MFTPLETALITFCSALVVGLIVRHLVGRNSVSCEECEAHRKVFREEIDAIAAKDGKDHAMILRMVRSIVVHLGVDAGKKEAILNDNGGPK